MKTITVEITPAGSVKIDVAGFNGVGCAKATEHLEVVLGGNGSKSKKKKPEFFSPASNQAGNKLTF